MSALKDIITRDFTEEKFREAKENEKISDSVTLKDLDEYEKKR